MDIKIRVKVVLSDDNIKAGGRNEYPDGQFGTVLEYESLSQRMARVKFGQAFIGKNMETGKSELKTDNQHAMWVPRALLKVVSEKEFSEAGKGGQEVLSVSGAIPGGWLTDPERKQGAAAQYAWRPFFFYIF